MGVFVVRPKGQDPQSTEGVRLVNAKNFAQARNHVASAFTIEAAKGTEAIELAQVGIKLEHANGSAAE